MKNRSKVSPSEDFAQRLRVGARKNTSPRRAVLEALRKQAHPLTIKELRNELKQTRCDLATIYRSVHLLEEMGLVQRYNFGDGPARFEFVAGHSEHHHHLICIKCAVVVEIEDCFSGDLEERIARGNGFTEVSHRLEFFGVCPECQEKGKRMQL